MTDIGMHAKKPFPQKASLFIDCIIVYKVISRTFLRLIEFNDQKRHHAAKFIMFNYIDNKREFSNV